MGTWRNPPCDEEVQEGRKSQLSIPWHVWGNISAGTRGRRGEKRRGRSQPTQLQENERGGGTRTLKWKKWGRGKRNSFNLWGGEGEEMYRGGKNTREPEGKSNI